jgi:hypothetical protein
MVQSMLPAEVVISIILGILQLIVGIISLWQQHYFRWAARKSCIPLKIPQSADKIGTRRRGRRRNTF